MVTKREAGQGALLDLGQSEEKKKEKTGPRVLQGAGREKTRHNPERTPA